MAKTWILGEKGFSKQGYKGFYKGKNIMIVSLVCFVYK